jgi:hypothetical protein
MTAAEAAAELRHLNDTLVKKKNVPGAGRVLGVAGFDPGEMPRRVPHKEVQKGGKGGKGGQWGEEKWDPDSVFAETDSEDEGGESTLPTGKPGWACTWCQSHNTNATNKCRQCAHHKPDPLVVKAKELLTAERGEWNCVKCTLVNTGNCDKCTACLAEAPVLDAAVLLKVL